jgi:hypothetical protein
VGAVGVAAACVEAAAAWDVEAEASQAVVGCLAVAAAEDFPAEAAEGLPAEVVASLAEAREVDRAAEDSHRARRSVALGLVHSPALEAEE